TRSRFDTGTRAGRTELVNNRAGPLQLSRGGRGRIHRRRRRHPDRGAIPRQAARGIVAVGVRELHLPGELAPGRAVQGHIRQRRIELEQLRNRVARGHRGLRGDRLGPRDAHPDHHRPARHEAGDLVTDLRSWPRQWNEAAMRRLVQRYEPSQPSRWTLFGMLALGLVAGAAVGGYAVSQRSRFERLPELALRVREMRAGRRLQDDGEATVVAVSSNPRRKATSEA